MGVNARPPRSARHLPVAAARRHQRERPSFRKLQGDQCANDAVLRALLLQGVRHHPTHAPHPFSPHQVPSIGVVGRPFHACRMTTRLAGRLTPAARVDVAHSTAKYWFRESQALAVTEGSREAAGRYLFNNAHPLSGWLAPPEGAGHPTFAILCASKQGCTKRCACLLTADCATAVGQLNNVSLLHTQACGGATAKLRPLFASSSCSSQGTTFQRVPSVPRFNLNTPAW